MLNEKLLNLIANTIRGLSIDAIDKANSGHPGLPLGCAEIFTYLYAHELKYNINDPDWLNRDRFILSAGHGSMGLYASLHLAGFDVTLDDLKSFRQIHAKTAGHPEYGEVHGVETTTGPLGQGISAAVGMALGLKILNDKFKTEEKDPMIDSNVFVLAGDGCMMEGVSSEASSFAGHLNLDNLILIYDSNDICLDGPTSECVSEDVKLRYESYGWFVQTINGHSFQLLQSAIEKAKATSKPSLIIAKTTIGKGSPTYEGTSEVHGKPLGNEEVLRVKSTMGIPESPDFYIPSEVKFHFEAQELKQKKNYLNWQEGYYNWRGKNLSLADLIDQFSAPVDEKDLYDYLNELEISQNKATRSQSSQCLQQLAQKVPNIIGGSADLSCSDNTFLKNYATISATDFSGRNIKYGVREFAMASMASGMVLTKMLRPYIGTFLVFSDYMRNAIRLSALMNIPVMYQFTHDSIFLGEDGPTHQPVEHLASLRAIPNLTVCRPADETEVKASWYLGMISSSPTAIILSRQNIQSLPESNFEHAIKGGYVLKESENAEITIFSTGSECSLAIEVSSKLNSEGIKTRVVSLMSWEVFQSQADNYKNEVIGNTKLNVSIEAASGFGWERFIGNNGVSISVDSFGLSGKGEDLKNHFGFNVNSILTKVKSALSALTTLNK